jgi:GTP-binding protein HflX
LADTVGFVSRLPHELVAAFRSTLEETRNASLLLHVVDASAPHRARLIADVEAVLAEIGSGEIPRIEVWNKIDLLPGESPRLERDDRGTPARVWLSAANGAGMDLLRLAVAELTGGGRLHRCLVLGPGEGRVRAWLYERATILAERPEKTGGWRLEVQIGQGDLDRLLAQEPGLAGRLTH